MGQRALVGELALVEELALDGGQALVGARRCGWPGGRSGCRVAPRQRMARAEIEFLTNSISLSCVAPGQMARGEDLDSKGLLLPAGGDGPRDLRAIFLLVRHAGAHGPGGNLDPEGLLPWPRRMLRSQRTRPSCRGSWPS